MYAMNGPTTNFWEHKAGRPLSVLLQKAGYGLEAHITFLRFFLDYTIDALGPSCNLQDGISLWKSFMSDDHTPIEFSWQWRATGNLPTIRYSIEAISPLAGTSADPFNIQAQSRLIEHLRNTMPLIDLSWYDHFATWLLPTKFPSTFGNTSTANYLEASPSTSFMGFDLTRSGELTAKAYFIPSKRADELGISNLALIIQAIQELPGVQIGDFSSLSTLAEFFEAEQSGMHLQCEILSLDCTSPESARLKIYIRSRSTSFNDVKAVMTLGGRNKSEDQKLALRDLFHLWRSLFSYDGVRLGRSTSLPPCDHRTAGVLYYFDISRNTPSCVPKVYLPVRHYASSDYQVARTLCRTMSKRLQRDAAKSYSEALRDIFGKQVLKHELGAQTYVGCAIKNGTLDITSYINPKVYSVQGCRPKSIVS